MSHRRKTSRRLKALRRLGIPVDGDGRLTAPWDDHPAGTMISWKDQRAIVSGTYEGWTA